MYRLVGSAGSEVVRARPREYGESGRAGENAAARGGDLFRAAKGGILKTRPDYEDLLAFHIRAEGLPEPERQFRFHPTRRWRADFCWTRERLLVEVDGGIWTEGRHTRGSGYEEDCRKLNAAAGQGYWVMRFSTGMVRSGEAIRAIAEWFKKNGAKKDE